MRSKHLKVGDTIEPGFPWRVVGIVEPGKLSRMFADLGYMQDKYRRGQDHHVYVKVDNPANVKRYRTRSRSCCRRIKSISLDQLTSLITVDSIPILKTFT